MSEDYTKDYESMSHSVDNPTLFRKEVVGKYPVNFEGVQKMAFSHRYDVLDHPQKNRYGHAYFVLVEANNLTVATETYSHDKSGYLEALLHIYLESIEV